MFEFEEHEYLDLSDPRDDALSTFHYYHPRQIPLGDQIEGMLGIPPGVERLVLLELLSFGLIIEHPDDSLSLSEYGLSFVEKRLEKWPQWAEYAIKPSAPALPPMGKSLLFSLKSYTLRSADKQFQKFLDNI